MASKNTALDPNSPADISDNTPDPTEDETGGVTPGNQPAQDYNPATQSNDMTPSPTEDETGGSTPGSSLAQPNLRAQSSGFQNASITDQPTGHESTIDVIGFRPPAQNALQGLAQNEAFGNDLATGKINPETYSGMFAKQDTLGKIGTLFGLLVSGAGSGLAHQSNAVLDMMNNEINRDLESQKTNAANKLNWYSASVAHERQLADIQAQNAATALTQQGVYNAALKNNKQAWDNKQLPGIADVAGAANAKNNMMTFAAYKTQADIDRLAPGPAKDKAQIVYNQTFKPAADAAMLQNQQDAANKIGLMHAINPHPLKGALQNVSLQKQAEEQSQNIDPVDEARLQTAITQGKAGSIGPEALTNEQNALAEAANARTLAQTRNQYHEAFNYLSSLNFGGQNPAGNVAQAALPIIGAEMAGPIGAGVGAFGASTLTPFKKYLQSKRDSAIAGLQEAMPGINVEDVLPGFANSSDKESLSNAINTAEKYFNKQLQLKAPTLYQKGIVRDFSPIGSPNAKQSAIRNLGSPQPKQPSQEMQKANMDEIYRNMAD